MSLATPEKIRILQRKLYRKAKTEPAFRFYLLYDKICREDILRHAYELTRANAGAPGVDGVTFAQIEEQGLDAWQVGLPLARRMRSRSCTGTCAGVIPTLWTRIYPATSTRFRITICSSRWRVARGIGLEDVAARAGAAGDDLETAWGRRACVRHSNHPGPGGSDCCQDCAATDLRA